MPPVSMQCICTAQPHTLNIERLPRSQLRPGERYRLALTYGPISASLWATTAKVRGKMQTEGAAPVQWQIEGHHVEASGKGGPESPIRVGWKHEAVIIALGVWIRQMQEAFRWNGQAHLVPAVNQLKEAVHASEWAKR